MTRRIFRSILAVTLTALVACLVLTVGVLHGYFQDRVLEELSSRTAYIARGVEQQGLDYLESGLPRDCRVTWVDGNGQVLWDNWEDPAALGSHRDRQEIQQALTVGQGHAQRYSDTLAEETLYYALRLQDGTVIRASDTQYSVWRLVLQALQPVALVALAAFVLALVLASRLARLLTDPINALDLEDPQAPVPYEELAPLMSRLASQRRQIRRQVEDLRRRQEEFAAITEHMSEGFLVIDRETRVLSHNSAALRLLEADRPGGDTGESVLALDRSAAFRRCVEQVLSGTPASALLERQGRVCQLIANPVEADGQPTGAVLVILDVTEREQRESLRREFTANVSHELKTPLTAISGTAEILENGLVKPEDVAHFAGNIHREALRLIGLVNDIIKLSRLDEGGDAVWETVDLLAQAQSVAEQLAPAAARAQVAFTVTGSAACVRGVPQIVEEIVYNLCDNAVAYNRPQGSVTVTVEDGAEGACLTVADTGIGIPQKDRDRVFERFYRADKSHSAGGTGLGLSIVKHGAAYLGAQVELESREGEGSVFRLRFPKVPEDA